jgi:hypothetical protein
VPHQYNGADPPQGEDSVGLGFCRLENFYSMIRRGGFTRMFKGRMYGSTWENAFDNGPLAGRGSVQYEFRNSVSVNLTNLGSEGAGGAKQFYFYNCRDLRAENLGVPVGAPTGEVPWAASTPYVVGQRVVPTKLYSPSTPAPRNRVYTVTVAGTSGAVEPAWPASGTIADGSITWQASVDVAASDGIVVEASEGCVFDGHYVDPGSPPASYRLTKAVRIDANSRNVKFNNWTIRGVVSGGAQTANADAANEVEILSTASKFNYAAGELVQAFSNWRNPYKLGNDQERPSGTASLDFPSIAAGQSQELTVTVPGAAVGDAVAAGPPSSLPAGLSATAYVSAVDTVSVRLSNPTAAAINPASASWKATAVKG